MELNDYRNGILYNKGDAPDAPDGAGPPRLPQAIEIFLKK